MNQSEIAFMLKPSSKTLSVIVPTYNRAKLLRSSIESVLECRHRPLEVIVVDDGSKDDTKKVVPDLEALSHASSASFVFVEQPNSGAATARNTGLKHASGDLVQWVDADDTTIPKGVDQLTSVLCEDEECDVAYGLVQRIDSEGRVGELMGKAPSHTERDYFDYLWHTMGAVYRRAALEKVGAWNPKLTLPDDWEFSCRVRIAGLRYKFMEVVAGNYVKYESGTLTIRGFDEAKCLNMIEAVISVRDALSKAGKLSPYLRQRCYNRALVHAVELSAHRSTLASEAYKSCQHIGSPNVLLRFLPLALQALALQSVDRLVFRALRAK